jgi:hypothetical protein
VARSIVGPFIFIPHAPIVQPCQEPCGFATGFDILTAIVIQIEKKSHLAYNLNLMLVFGSMLQYLGAQYFESTKLLEHK